MLDVLSFSASSYSTNDRCPASWFGPGDRCCQPAETPGTQQARDDLGDTRTTLRFQRYTTSRYAPQRHKNLHQYYSVGIDIIEIIGFAVLNTF